MQSSTPKLDEGLNPESSYSEERGCSSSKLKRPKRNRKSKSSASERLIFLNILKEMQEEKNKPLVSFPLSLKIPKRSEFFLNKCRVGHNSIIERCTSLEEGQDILAKYSE